MTATRVRLRPPAEFHRFARRNATAANRRASPNSTHVVAARPAENESTRQSGPRSTNSGLTRTHEADRADEHGRHHAPPPAPSTASTKLSTRSWRTMRARPAPSPRRIEISRSRAEARATSRLARLAHAIRSTNPTRAARIYERRPSIVWRRNEKPGAAGSTVEFELQDTGRGIVGGDVVAEGLASPRPRSSARRACRPSPPPARASRLGAGARSTPSHRLPTILETVVRTDGVTSAFIGNRDEQARPEADRDAVRSRARRRRPPSSDGR